MGQGEMVDMLASRKGEEEALCAICADGTSVEPNVIVFCERCDMAVHQLCYGIEQIPSGEQLLLLDTVRPGAAVSMFPKGASHCAPALCFLQQVAR